MKYALMSFCLLALVVGFNYGQDVEASGFAMMSPAAQTPDSSPCKVYKSTLKFTTVYVVKGANCAIAIK